MRTSLLLAALLASVVGLDPAPVRADPGVAHDVAAVEVARVGTTRGLALRPTPTVADSVDWPGLEVVEPRLRAEIAELWAVAPAELVLEFGTVNTPWIPGPEFDVELRGTGRGGWFIAVASDPAGSVSFRLRAGRSVLRTVAARPLTRGEFLAEEDVSLARVAEWGLESAEVPAEVIGWEVKRAIPQGDVLSPPSVAPPAAVVSGGPVEIELRHGAVSITLSGSGLGTVPVGEEVFVRTSTGERLRGVATAPGRVVVQSSSTGGIR